MTALVPLPPQYLDAEEHVLGAMMLSARAIDDVIAVGLVAGDFYRPSHGVIFDAIVELHAEGVPVDPLLVCDRLTESGKLADVSGGKDRIREIATLVPAVSNAAHHARIVEKNAREREIIEITTALTAEAHAGMLNGTAKAKVTRIDELLRPRVAPGDRDWLVDAGVLLTQPDPGPTAWLIEDLIVEESLLACVGSWKTFKSYVMLDNAISIATGRPALGRFEIPTSGPVVYVIEESVEAALRRRIDALCRGRGIDSGELDGKLFVATNRGVRLDDPTWQRRLFAIGEELRPRLILFDPLARLKSPSRDENAQGAMAEVIEFLRRLRDETGSTVGFVHHTGHFGDQMRGSSDLESAWESRIGWEREEKSPYVTLSVQHREAEGAAAFRVRPAWDEMTRSMRFDVADDHKRDRGDRDYKQEVLDFLQANHPAWYTAPEIAKTGIVAQRRQVDIALDELEAVGAVLRQNGAGGRSPRAICFQGLVPASGRVGTSNSAGTLGDSSPNPLPPLKGGGFGTSTPDQSSEPSDEWPE